MVALFVEVPIVAVPVAVALTVEARVVGPAVITTGRNALTASAPVSVVTASSSVEGIDAMSELKAAPETEAVHTAWVVPVRAQSRYA